MSLRENYMINANFQSTHNPPPQSTPFIGRAPEITQIVGLIDDPACRLITLVGSGARTHIRKSRNCVSQT